MGSTRRALVVEASTVPGIEGVTDGDRRPQGRQWMRRRPVVSAVVVVVLATAGALAAVQVASAREHAAAVDAYAAAASELTAVLAELEDTVTDAETSTGGLAGEVADATTLNDVASTITAAGRLGNAPDASPDADWRRWGTTRLEAGTGDLETQVNEAREASEAVSAAVLAVQASHLTWAVAGAVTAAEELTAALDQAAGVLAASDGKVDDPAVRDALAEAIATASAVRDRRVDAGDATAPTVHATAMREQTTSLGGATQAVSDAQSAWEQAEAERLAAERVAAAGKPSTSSRAPAPSKPSGGAPSAPSAPSTAAAGPSAEQDNRSAADILGGSNCVATDTHGNSWDC